MKIFFLLSLIFGLASAESTTRDVKEAHPPFNPTRFAHDGRSKFLPNRPYPLSPYPYPPRAFYPHQRLRGGLIPYYFQSQTTPAPFLIVTPVPVFINPNVLNKNIGFDDSARVASFGGSLPLLPIDHLDHSHVGQTDESSLNKNESIFDESSTQNEALKSKNTPQIVGTEPTAAVYISSEKI